MINSGIEWIVLVSGVYWISWNSLFLKIIELVLVLML